MTPEAFQSWLADMKEAGIARFDRDCAALLNITPKTLALLKRHGTDRRTALACTALLYGLPPYEHKIV